MAKTSKKRTASSKTGFDISLDIIGLLLIALSLIGLATLFTSNEGSIGTVGLLIKKAATTMAGSGYGVLLIIFILTGLRLMTRRKWRINSRFWGLMILFGSLQIFLHRHIPLDESFPIGLEGHGGGIIGGFLNYGLKYCFGNIGTYIFNLLFLILGISLFTGGTVRETIVGTWIKCKNGALGLLDQIMDFLFTTEDEDDTQEAAQKKGSKKVSDENTLPVIDFQRSVLTAGPEVINESEEPMEDQQNTSADGDVADKTPHTHQGGQVYHLPPLSLLAPLPTRPDNQTASKDINQRIKVLEQILESFGIKAPVSHVSVGPSITRYELQPPPGVKVSKIVGLSDDIALGMATTGVRIEAPIPGKSAVGIEVPNEEVSAVTLRELLEDKTFTASTSRLSVAFGKDIAGTAIVSDLAKMPHLLIAGATGSGKSVCVNTIICSVLYKATPDEVKFLMVDPKMVELTNYNGIPHLVSPVVTNAKKAAGALRWAVREMETRYDLFAAAGVRDIGRYNSLVGDDPEQGSLPMPYIVVIIDELADLMMVAPADVEDAICRLAQMARAAGIHLVVATQRPSVDVITGLIKANIPSRLSFAVSSQIDSRTILDMGGAEKLLGKGDMLFHPVGASKPIRVQGAFISDEDVESLVDFLKEQARPVYNEEVLETNVESEALSFEDADELLAQAVKLFIESGTASISLLQRRLHIGYARAARLVDIMEQRGIVGGFEGSKPRAVLMTMELYRQTFESESKAV